MRKVIIGILFLVAAWIIAPGCAWLHSGTPGANTTQTVIDCTTSGVIDASEKALPDLIVWVLQAVAGNLSWTGLLNAFGGVETLVKDGVAVVTCDVDALALYFEQLAAGAAASQPTLAPQLKGPDAATAGKLLRFYLALTHRSVVKRLPPMARLQLQVVRP